MDTTLDVMGLFHAGRVQFKPEDWPPFTFDMDSLVLHPVPNPGGAFPWTRYCSVLGTPGLTAYAGFEEFAEAKQVGALCTM